LKEVLDTRFLTEYFYSTETESKKKIERKLTERITRNEGILPTIVIAEITKITCERRGKEIAESRYQALTQSGLRIQNLTPTIAKQTGLLKSRYKNIP
jgi:predicted nucleic acid-binding protein